MDQLKAANPALFTLDLEMSEKWGPRLYHKLTKDPDHKDTPIIVVTGLSPGQYAIKNTVATLSKPFEPGELIGIVQETIGGPE